MCARVRPCLGGLPCRGHARRGQHELRAARLSDTHARSPEARAACGEQRGATATATGRRQSGRARGSASECLCQWCRQAQRAGVAAVCLIAWHGFAQAKARRHMHDRHGCWHVAGAAAAHDAVTAARGAGARFHEGALREAIVILIYLEVAALRLEFAAPLLLVGLELTSLELCCLRIADVPRLSGPGNCCVPVCAHLGPRGTVQEYARAGDGGQLPLLTSLAEAERASRSVSRPSSCISDTSRSFSRRRSILGGAGHRSGGAATTQQEPGQVAHCTPTRSQDAT